MIDCISLFMKSFLAKIVLRVPWSLRVTRWKTLLRKRLFPGGIRGIYGDYKMTIVESHTRPEIKYLGATQTERKMNINLYKRNTTVFLLKKTGFKRMTEVKF